MRQMVQKGRGVTGLLLAMAVLFTLLLQPVMAAPTADGYNPDSKATLTIHKYAVKEDWVLSMVPDGSTVTGNPQIGVDGEGNPVYFNDLTGKALAGITFQITLVQLKAGKTEGSTNVDDYEAVPAPNAYSTSGTTAADGTILFQSSDDSVPDTNGLPHGIYLVHEVDNEDVAKKAADFLVSVPMVNPDGDGWNYSVHAYPKNVVETGPEIHKDVTQLGNQHDSSFTWDDVHWIITTQIPVGIGDSLKYIVTDELDPIFKYQSDPADSLQVSYIDPTTSSPVPLTGAHYVFTLTNSDVSAGNTGNYPHYQTITVELTPAGRAELVKAFPAGFDKDTDALPMLTVSFDTCFDIENISEAELLQKYIGVEIDNQATLDYTNKIGTDYKTYSEEPEVHTGGLQVKKVDTSGNIITSGAKFALFTSAADANAYLAAVSDADKEEALKKAVKDPVTGEPMIKTTGADGIAHFLGLEYGDTGDDNDNSSREYWLVETAAPSGYNALKKAISVTVTKNSHTAVAGVSVTNATGFTLPFTGGVGTVLFAVCGVLLIGVGTTLYLRSRGRKNAR